MDGAATAAIQTQNRSWRFKTISEWVKCGFGCGEDTLPPEQEQRGNARERIMNREQAPTRPRQRHPLYGGDDEIDGTGPVQQ